MDSVSRFKYFIGKPSILDKKDVRQGDVITDIIVDNTLVSVILHFKDGYLHSERDMPAVQCEDGHSEYWEMGQLSNTRVDKKGHLLPAVITAGGLIKEYWIKGRQVYKDKYE